MDALLSIEMAVTQERPTRSGEAHHRQGNRDWHIHLGARLLKPNFQFSLVSDAGHCSNITSLGFAEKGILSETLYVTVRHEWLGARAIF